jgi:hypothetical protein
MPCAAAIRASASISLLIAFFIDRLEFSKVVLDGSI